MPSKPNPDLGNMNDIADAIRELNEERMRDKSTTYSINLIPAYGQDYQFGYEVADAWYTGKDFKIADISSLSNGGYTSIRDFSQDTVRIRYNKLADFIILKPFGILE